MNSEKRKYSDDNDGVEKKTRSDESGHIYQLRAFHADRKGEREEMQDAHVVVDQLECELTKWDEIHRVSYYAVFDGHGGARASRFAAENLHRNWSATLAAGVTVATLEQNLKRCFIEAYKKTDEQFLNQAVKVKPVWKDGTTATALFVINNCLYVTNLGDSRAVLCRYKPEDGKEVPVVLTKDHNPTVFEERMRIQKAGGVVKDGRVMGVLEVSRSIGDGQYKNYGITCLPDVKRCTLTEHDRYILMGCDGLWKVFNNQEALDYVSQVKKEIWKDERIVEAGDIRWENVCHRLASEAVRKGSGDNVTVLMIVVGRESQLNTL